MGDFIWSSMMERFHLKFHNVDGLFSRDYFSSSIQWFYFEFHVAILFPVSWCVNLVECWIIRNHITCRFIRRIIWSALVWSYKYHHVHINLKSLEGPQRTDPNRRANYEQRLFEVLDYIIALIERHSVCRCYPKMPDMSRGYLKVPNTCRCYLKKSVIPKGIGS